MNSSKKPSSVVAGIDGSESAVRAAQWAIAEAVSRGVPLRLVYVTKANHPSTADYERDVEHGKASLRGAKAAIESLGPVTVQTAILAGPPGAALIAESDEAAMICVATVGIDRYARSILGSTATELAEHAHCPVAVIRPQPDDDSPEDIHWIAVAINDEADNPAVVEHAMAEAKLRHAPVLAIGERRADRGTREGLGGGVGAGSPGGEVDRLRERNPDVHIYPIADQTDVASFLRHCAEKVQLAVIGGSEADQLADIVGTVGPSVFHHAKVSVLVVRD